jgi:D-alanyl-D-alanine carboxypeptidase
MTRVMNYAGYLTTASGQELAFAVMVNHYDCTNGEMRKKLEKLLVEIPLFEKQR